MDAPPVACLLLQVAHPRQLARIVIERPAPVMVSVGFACLLDYIGICLRREYAGIGAQPPVALARRSSL